MQDRISVIVVDSFPVVQWGVRELLANRNGVSVVGESNTLSHAIGLVKLYEPDVVITEMALPDGNGVNGAAEFIRLGAGRVIAFSEIEAWDTVQAFLEAGGLAYVLKRAPVNDLLAALDAVVENRRWISPELREPARKPKHDIAGNDNRLSPREQEIAELIAQGLSSKQIADQLCVCLKTIESHRYRIFKKLGIHRSAQLAGYVVKRGLLTGS